MIVLRDLALRRGPHLLLSGVNVTLHAGWRVGVVGRNGCGKSSLFAALRRELDLDAGDIEMPSRVRIASVAQETPGLPESALDFVLGGDAEVAAARNDEIAASARGDAEAAARAHHRLDELAGYDAEARAGRLLHGLGFAAEAQRLPVSSFSGGWRMRLNLGRALMAPSDLLLLDEPTNHLDLDAVVWLEDWLKRYEGTVLLISHDREFLDGVVDHVLHLERGGARAYAGNYSSFESQRAEQLRQQQLAHEREQAERAKLQRFVDRFKAKASKAKQAQSRVKRLQKLAGTEAVRLDRGFSFSFELPGKLPNPLLRLRHVDCGYRAGGVDGAGDATVGGRASAPGASSGAAVNPSMGASTAPSMAPTTPEDAPGADARLAGVGGGGSVDQASGISGGDVVVLRDVSLGLEPGDRIGLLGRNGEGKSTLVKTMAGEIGPLSGERLAHGELAIGYFAQHTVDALRSGESPMQHLREQDAKLSEQQAREVLGRWNFHGDRVFETVDGFSGGERARLALALIAHRKPNLLLLDEPTNHLDLDMREALAEALQDYPGALVLVAHDRHLLGLVCDDFWRVSDGGVTPFDGDLDDYAAWLRGRGRPTTGGRALDDGKPKSNAAPTPAEPAVDARDRRRLAAEQRERERPLRQRLGRIEKRLAEIETARKALAAELEDPATYDGPPDRAVELGRQLAELARETEPLEEEWLALHEQLGES